VAGVLVGVFAAMLGMGQGETTPAMSPIAMALNGQRSEVVEAAAAAQKAAVAPSTTSTTTAPEPGPMPEPTVATAPPPPPVTTPPPPAEPRPRPASSSAPRVLPRGSGGTWAVVLGVDEYRGDENLDAAVADANEMVATLVAANVPGQNILLLRNSEVTPASILAATDWLVDNTGEDGLALFMWAGHVRPVGADTEALATGDGGMVTDKALAARLRPLRAKRSWIMIAGCYGGGFTELLGPGRLLTAASTADKEAYENTLLGHSYLVEYVVRRSIHNGEGPREVIGAVGWAQSRIKKEHPGREPTNYVSGPVAPFALGPNPTPAQAAA